MQSAVLTEPETFEFEERSRPDPGPTDVLVAVGRVGICGSDVHYYRHGRIGDFVVENPLVLGHESAGEIVAVGADVEDVAVGDRVALEPGVPCFECDACRRGEYNLCPDVRFMATPPVDGAFTEYVAWPAEFAYPLPENVSTQAGALCEPLSVGLHAARRGNVGVGDTVLITGGGPIGMLAMEAARVAGASQIILSDVVPEKLDRARERGADATVDPSQEDLAERVADLTRDDGVDVAIEASGAAAAIRSTTEVVRQGGSVALVGLAGEGEIPLDTHDIINGELDVHGSFRFRNTYPAAIDLLASGDVDVEGIIDFEMPLSEVTAAFERTDDPSLVKGMITVGD
ncbi:NAD(P)-dependent alcohol dehydrogenase (plasmid) [Haloplanus ruber]|uniref:L-threonine 3-dehydrogenase n=1 Tax=Haloplanus ruber TaxID=869892 RepID=A0ABD6CVE6_9EURY|nr:NAD(P)-dependent alcohol dehydrogenase [Haloplanus ruber]